MAAIHLTTFIAAPVERVFDLSRSINLHKISTAHTGEKAVAGVMNGLIGENETVTWQAKHLFKLRRFTSKIMELKRPVFFIDRMIEGDFKSYTHDHHFKATDNGTIMIDLVHFESPYALLGKLFDTFYLKNYLHNLLLKRNTVIKEYAETSRWKTILIN